MSGVEVTRAEFLSEGSDVRETYAIDRLKPSCDLFEMLAVVRICKIVARAGCVQSGGVDGTRQRCCRCSLSHPIQVSTSSFETENHCITGLKESRTYGLHFGLWLLCDRRSRCYDLCRTLMMRPLITIDTLRIRFTR